MASDISTLSTYSNVTREAHRKKVAFSGNKDTWLFDYLKTDPQKHAGESLVNFSLQTQLPESATFTSENAAHPTAVQPDYAKGQLYIKKLLAIMKYSEETVHLNKGQEAIIRDLMALRDGTYAAYLLLRDFSIHTPGSGILATATSQDSDQTFTVDSVRWLRKGMIIDGYNGSNHQDADSIVITDINPSTLTVTVTGTITDVDTDTNFYYNDTYTASGGTIATTKYTNGIETICSDSDPAYGNFEGLDRGSYEYAKATVKYGTVPGTAEAFTLDRLYELIELGVGNVGLSKLSKFALCSPKCLRAIYNTFRDEQQPTVNMPAREGMPETLGFKYGSHEFRLYGDYRSAPNTLYFPNSNYIIKYNGGPEGWDNYSGSTVNRFEGYQSFYEIYRGWWNYGTDFPQANMALYDITEA
ncbi:MAG: hypothetical protein ABIH23_09205 [bacterium]